MNTTPLNKLSEIIKESNKIIIGQEQLVNFICVAIYKFWIKSLANQRMADFINTNSNLLIAGNSGTGKTFAVKTICDLLNIPFIEINSKSICQEGWVGTSFIDLLGDGLELLGEPTHAVVFLDEFDKLIEAPASSDNAKYALSLQYSLLKYVEGFKATLKSGNRSKNIDTSNMCFIFGGVFYGLTTNITKAPCGFLNNENEVLPTESTLINRLITFGVIPELAGRINEVVITNNFTREDYVVLLNSPQFVFNKWLKLFDSFNLKLESSYNKEDLVSGAIKRNIGVRGLIQECESVLNKFFIEHSNDIDVDKFNELLELQAAYWAPYKRGNKYASR